MNQPVASLDPVPRLGEFPRRAETLRNPDGGDGPGGDCAAAGVPFNEHLVNTDDGPDRNSGRRLGDDRVGQQQNDRDGDECQPHHCTPWINDLAAHGS